MNNTRRIHRNTRDGKIGGVAEGLGDYLAVDPVIIRLVFVLTAFLGGFGVIAYLVAWIIIPSGSPEIAASPSEGRRRWDGRLIAGILIAGIGAVAFAGSTGTWWGHGPGLWPLLLVGAGAVLILWRRDRYEPGPAAPAEGPGNPEPEPSTPDGGGSDPQDEASEPGIETGDETETAVIGGAQAPPTAASVALGATTEYPTATPLPERRRRFPVGWITLGAVLTAGALIALLDQIDAVDVSVQSFLLVALGLSAIGLVAGALVGRVWGPLALGAVSAVALVGVSILDVPIEGGVGERTYRPASASELEDDYRLGAGRLVLDLRDLDVGAVDERVEASVGLGELVVIAPPGIVTLADGSASVGEIALFGQERRGLQVDSSVTGVPAPGALPTGRIVLDLEVGVGRIDALVADSLYDYAESASSFSNRSLSSKGPINARLSLSSRMMSLATR